MTCKLTLLLVLVSSMAFGQGVTTNSARSMSMANASTTFNDVWAFHNNPGALGDVEQLSIGLSYENRFLLKELQTQGVAIAVPLKVGVISAGGDVFGYRNYRSYRAGLGYSMKLSDNFFAGVQLNYQGLALSSNYGSKNTLTAGAGVYAKVTDNWKIGVSVFNLGRAKLSEFEDDRFSTVLRLGTSFKFSKKFLLSFEGEKDLDYDFRLKTGLEYEAIKKFYLRGGVATHPLEVSFGLGYHFEQFHIDLGSSYHQILGWSPHFSFVFQTKPSI